LLAASVCLTGVRAQNSQKPVAASRSACITPVELTTQRLYGLWDTDFFELPPPAKLSQGATGLLQYRGSLQLERHPEHANSVRGTLSLQGKTEGASTPFPSVQLSGDVEDGEMILDESEDGVRISAVWVGTATAEGCGLEIRGTRRLAGEESGQLFVMTKTPGWR
jgi:hypothetical protein